MGISHRRETTKECKVLRTCLLTGKGSYQKPDNRTGRVVNVSVVRDNTEYRNGKSLRTKCPLTSEVALVGSQVGSEDVKSRISFG